MAANANLLGALDASGGETGGQAGGITHDTAANADYVGDGSAPESGGRATDDRADSAERSGGDVQHSDNGTRDKTARAGIDTDDAATVRKDTVPQGALHEARAQVKALKAQLAALDAQPKLTPEDAALLRELREQKAANGARVAEPPDFLADPKGYVDAQVKTARDQAEAARKEGEEAKRAAEEQRTRQEVFRNTATAEAQFMQTAPDYPQALEHIRAVHRQQLAIAHPEATPEQIAAHMAYVEMQTATNMLAQGRNPAQYAYEVAKTWGYKPAARGNAQTANAPRVDREAARSLGSGGADGGDDGGDGIDGIQEFTAARRERFERRK